MLFGDHLVLLRGGGDLATGVAWRMRRSGFPVVILELARPLAIRRRVAFSSVVLEGEMVLDGVTASLVASPSDALSVAQRGEVAVTVSADLPEFSRPPSVLVDCRLAKRNIDTRIDQARLVVGLGPGFEAGVDCDAVVETKRGHRLGRVLWIGAAASDTGVPGRVGGESARRVLRAPSRGQVAWSVDIGDAVVVGAPLGKVGETAVVAPISGVVRGLITPGHIAEEGLKIGDIDPRGERSACFEISDKAMSVAGGVLEAVLTRLDRGSK